MRTLPWPLAVIAALTAGGPPATADELLPPDRPIEQAVDHYIDAQLQEEGITAAPQADDSTLIRRLTLDLVGRIPTAAETRAYVTATEPDKRVRLVERLMASPGWVRHQANELDVLLMDGTPGSLRDYLTRALRENRPWDRIFREVVLADERDPGQRGVSAFLEQRLKDVDKLTNDVSTVFFGVNVSCAKCHDHPLVHDWKQDHFYGMKSFFSRTYAAGNFVGERDYAVVKFKTTKGEERQAKLMFLTGKVVEEPARGAAAQEEPPRKRGKRDRSAVQRTTPPPPPQFSARAKLVELALEPGQRDFFARSIVNRVWQRLFGTGLVTPVDQMHSENPPSHPELLQWLARDTVAHGYDLRRLVRGLVLSRAYARSSRWEGRGPAPKPRQFAVARVRPLTPPQLAASLRLATTDPATLPAGLKPDEFERRVQGLEDSARGFAALLEQPREDFQVSVGEALLFSNSDRIRKEFLADGGDRLVGRLRQIEDDRELIDTAVRNVLCRPPAGEESQLLGDYLKQRADRRDEACRQLVWALLTSAEFRFNY
jgi:hypothetical protein